MWGFGLEHEVRMGFNKKIEPNIYLLKNYLERNKKNNSFKKLNIPKHRDTLLKLINKNFDLNNSLNKTNNQKNNFEIKNIEEIFNIKLRKIKEDEINLNTIYYLLEHVTILIGSQCFGIVKNCLLDNILNYYINLKPNEQKKIKLFKEINNYIENINNVKSILIKRRIYNKNNNSFINKKISFNGRLTKLKYFKQLNKKESEVENKLYENYIKFNFFRFYTLLGLETNFSLSSGNFTQDIYKLLNDMNDDNGLFWNYVPKKKFSVAENEIKNLILEFKTYYINKVIKRLIDLDENRKYLFPKIKKSRISCKYVLQQDKNIKDINQFIYGYQILTFENMENDLFTTNEIYQQIDYLLDVYIQLSNKNLNFLNYSVDNIIERGKLNKRIDLYKLNYPINTLINMYDKEAIDSDWSQGHLPQLIEYKSLNYKNVQIESVVNEVETYQKIVTEIMNDFYKGSKYDLYGGIKILERGGDKNVIFLDEDGLGRKIHKNDYFGSYHLWLTMPAKNLKTFVDEHVMLGKLLQWCEPLFFVFYVNNIYDDVGSYRFLLNKYGGYGTSNPNLLKNSSTKFELCNYYDGRDKEKLIEKIKNNDFETFTHPLHVFDCIDTCIYNKNGKKIINRNGLEARNITVDRLLKKNNCKKTLKTYIDILWEKADYKGDINMGADIRTGDDCENICWQNNFEPKLKKNWENIIIRKTNGKFYKVYFNRKTNKLSETPPLSKSKTKSRTGIEFRVFDNMNIHYMYDVLFFIILLFVVITHKKNDNIPLAIDTKEWNETISNCIMKGVNQFKLNQKYVKKLCELIQIPYKNKTNMVDLFQYLIDTLHKKYGNNSLFKKMVKNYNLNIKIPNINLYYLQQNKRRIRNEFTI